MKRTPKTVLRMFLRACEKVYRKTCINIEANRKSSQFSYSVTVSEITIKLLAFVTPPYIYHGCSTQKTFWEDNFTLVNMRSGRIYNVRKNKETKKRQALHRL